MPLAMGGGEKLTLREVEVLKLIANGLTTKRIARSLDITFKTAACHRLRIMEKLDVHGVADLTRYAIRHGYVDLGGNGRASERQKDLFEHVRAAELRYRKAMEEYGAFIKNREDLGLTNPDGITGARRLRHAEEMAHQEYHAALIALKNFLFREIN
jgi:DNA-binding CsgD family transcriptional regulator